MENQFFSHLKVFNRFGSAGMKNVFLFYVHGHRVLCNKFVRRKVIWAGRSGGLNMPAIVAENVCLKSYKSTFEALKLQTKGSSNNREMTEKKGVENASKYMADYFDMLRLKKSVNVDDWEKLEEVTLNNKTVNVNKKNVETFTMKYISQYKDLHFARCYYNYLKSKNVNINMVTLSWYLRVCFLSGEDLTKSDLALVESVCDDISRKLPFVEIRLAESLIYGLCLTERWKESFNVIEYLKEYYDISLNIYSAIVITAFKNGEYNTGWKLMEEITTKGFFNERMYSTWLYTEKDKSAAISKILNFFSKYNVIPKMEFAENLLTLVKQNIDFSNAKPALTEVTLGGKCKNCGKHLRQEMLTESEFERLRSSFLDPVIVGNDVFLKSNPEELDQFLAYLSKIGPYDYVLDGLNIAYCVGPWKNLSSSVYSEKLKAVVAYLVGKKKKVLVLGRKHMKHWPKKDISYIEKHAHLFLMENVSADDPYLLYAALYGGMNTCFISRDMMRGHKFLLSKFNQELNSLFWRWQCQHQYVLMRILNNGNVVFRAPVEHLQTAHQLDGDSGRWHVPCDSASEPNTPGHMKFAIKNWLCLPSV